MSSFPQLFQFLVVALAGWIDQQQRDVIDYLQEENRVLREQLGPRRLRFTMPNVDASPPRPRRSVGTCFAISRRS